MQEIRLLLHTQHLQRLIRSRQKIKRISQTVQNWTSHVRDKNVQNDVFLSHRGQICKNMSLLSAMLKKRHAHRERKKGTLSVRFLLVAGNNHTHQND